MVGVRGSGGASITRLRIDEPGFDGKLTVELYHEPGWFPVPPAAGDLVLVRVSQGEGKQAFFVVSDLALELGTERVHHVVQENASDLLGQALGGGSVPARCSSASSSRPRRPVSRTCSPPLQSP